jgi:hypothetical protein
MVRRYRRVQVRSAVTEGEVMNSMATRKVRKTDPQSRVTVLILDQIMGKKLREVEVNANGEGPSGGSDVVLHFEGGKEILIYVHEDGTLYVEGD